MLFHNEGDLINSILNNDSNKPMEKKVDKVSRFGGAKATVAHWQAQQREGECGCHCSLECSLLMSPFLLRNLQILDTLATDGV